MISIWQLVDDSWQIVEEMEDDLALAQRLEELRNNGGQYRAEKRTGGFASILGD
jgi:hypothetical protein